MGVLHIRPGGQGGLSGERVDPGPECGSGWYTGSLLGEAREASVVTTRKNRPRKAQCVGGTQGGWCEWRRESSTEWSPEKCRPRLPWISTQVHQEAMEMF